MPVPSSPFVASRFEPRVTAGPVHCWFLLCPTATSERERENPLLSLTTASPGWIQPLQVSAQETQHLEPILSQSYRSILPTSLTCIVLSISGCSSWRPAVVMSTTGLKKSSSPLDFQGPQEHTRHHKRCGALPDIEPYLQTIQFQGESPLKTKENSFWGPHQRLRIRLCSCTCQQVAICITPIAGTTTL